MTEEQPRSRLTRSLLISIIGIVLILLCEYLGFFEGINTYLYDTSMRMRGVRNPSDRILIASVDERTLDALGRWPLRRMYYARLLDKLREATVVGFDMLIAEPSDDDALLAEAVKRHGRVVLPVYIDDEGRRVDPGPLLLPKKLGHVHVEPGIDGVTREAYHTLYYQGQLVPSLVSSLYEIVTNQTLRRSDPPAKNQDEVRAKTIVQMDPMRVNFYGPPRTFQQVSLADIIGGRFSDEFFRGKVVLVGVTAAGTADKALTPFSQSRKGMPGVELHANMLNNLLDGSRIRVVTPLLQWPLVIALSIVLFLLFRKMNEKADAVIWLGSLLLLTLVSFSLFSLLNVWLPPALYYCSVSFLFVSAYISGLDSAARKLDHEYSSVNHLLGWEDGTLGTAPKTGLLSFLSRGGITSKIENLVSIEKHYERKLEDTVQKRTHELTTALAMISNMSNEMILRLTRAAESKDVDTGEHIARIGFYAKRLSQELGMSEDFIETITFASAMHDIGKIGIPDRILLKAGELTPEESEIMKTHTTIGERILANSEYPKLKMSAVVALNHHERWDGTGYPRGIKGDEIPIEARIVMVCDYYDSMRRKRPYKPPFDHAKTCRIIIEGDDRTKPEYFDPDVLNTFIRISPEFEKIFAAHND